MQWQKQDQKSGGDTSLELFYVRDTYLRWLEANPVYVTLVTLRGSKKAAHDQLGITSIFEQTAAEATRHHDIGAKDHRQNMNSTNGEGDISATIERLQNEISRLSQLVAQR